MFQASGLALSRALERLRPLLYRAERTPLVSALWPFRAHIMELGLILGFYLAYLLSRGLVHSDPGGTGLVNAGRIVTAEQSLGIFWEPGIQSWVLTHAPGLAAFFNWTYIFTYWPIIALVGFALYVARRPRYYYFRTVMAINLVFALLIFMFFPVTSPFNLPQYFVNTIQQLGPSFYGSPEMGGLYNAHAAMPSLHFSWTIILGVLFLRSFKGWGKVVGIAYPVITLMAIIVTGNHFILDAVAGGALAMVSFGVMELAFRGGFHRARARLEALWREAQARPALAALRYEFTARRGLTPSRREIGALEARYRRAWSQTQERLLSDLRRNYRAWLQAQERLLSDLRRNWMYYRVAWLRFRARRPLVFRRPTTWGGGRIT